MSPWNPFPAFSFPLDHEAVGEESVEKHIESSLDQNGASKDLKRVSCVQVRSSSVSGFLCSWHPFHRRLCNFVRFRHSWSLGAWGDGGE